MNLGRVAFGALALTLAASPAPAEDAALQVLRAGLGDSIEFRKAPRLEVRYCPDNTCEAFRAGKRGQPADVAAFALLYLWHVSDYTYLPSWRQEPMPPEISGVLARYGAGCATASNREQVKCTLRALARKAEIQVFFIRYDEGEVGEMHLDLQGELDRWK